MDFLTTGLGIIGSLLKPKQKIQRSDFDKFFERSGYWTNKFISKMMKHMVYSEDLNNVYQIHRLSQELAHENLKELSGGIYENLSNVPPVGYLDTMVTKLNQLIDVEQKGTVGNGKDNTGGLLAGGVGALGSSSLLLVGGIILVLVLFMKGKK